MKTHYAPNDGTTTNTIESVYVIINEKEKLITITDMFKTWEYDGSVQIRKRLADLSDEEILDALVIASKVGKDLSDQGYKVNY